MKVEKIDYESKIKKCKSYSEVGRLLGYNYYNGRVKQEIIIFCLEHEIDIEKQISDWKNRKVYCLNCGKEITGDDRFRKKFCCSSCSASYSNRLRPPKTEEERMKISKGLSNYYRTHSRVIRTNKNTYESKSMLISDCISNGFVLNPFNSIYNDKVICERKYSEKTCVICGKKFKPFINKNGNLYKGSTCSEECHKKLISLRTKESIEKIISEGRHKGWQSRNILSYPEKFWFEVLKNNNIEYIPNKPVKQENGVSNYFIDFYIEKNGKLIDLEIDGKQHEYKDRIESDLKRDAYLKSIGFIIYRIKWNEISSQKGKENMKKKINDFFEFYKSI